MEEFKILTQRKKGEAHKETLVKLSWDDISERDLKVMAKGLIVYVIQCQIRKSTGPFPELLIINAKDMVHMEPAQVAKKFNLPRQKDWMDKLLEGLTAEQKAAFLESLA